jgi:hypothetical protein
MDFRLQLTLSFRCLMPHGDRSLDILFLSRLSIAAIEGNGAWLYAHAFDADEYGFRIIITVRSVRRRSS